MQSTISTYSDYIQIVPSIQTTRLSSLRQGLQSSDSTERHSDSSSIYSIYKSTISTPSKATASPTVLTMLPTIQPHYPRVTVTSNSIMDKSSISSIYKSTISASSKAAVLLTVSTVAQDTNTASGQHSNIPCHSNQPEYIPRIQTSGSSRKYHK